MYLPEHETRLAALVVNRDKLLLDYRGDVRAQVLNYRTCWIWIQIPSIVERNEQCKQEDQRHSLEQLQMYRGWENNAVLIIVSVGKCTGALQNE